MYVTSVSLRKVRSFLKLDLDLTTLSRSGVSTPRLRTILIGENGTGKTTLLRAIAVGLANSQDASGLLAEPTGQFVAGRRRDATIKLDLRPSQRQGKSKTYTTVIRSQTGEDVLESKDPELPAAKSLVCGYGISRANEGGPETGRPYRIIDSVYSLFQYEQALISTELALLRLRDYLGSKRYPLVMDRIKEALGLGAGDSIVPARGGGVRISGKRIGQDIPLEGWADGYRKTLAWILDLYAWAMRANAITQTGDVRGIVLIDELEQHLHPSLQIKLVPRLRKLLPRAQIIATTHSPLVALGAAPEELVVLKRDGNKVVASEYVRDFRGYSVEDMLSDPKIFDSEVYAPPMAQKLEHYRKLVSRSPARRSPQERRELRKLASELAAEQLPEAVDEGPAMKELGRILKKHNL